MKYLVFTYGTLKKNYYNHHLLETSEFIGNAVTKPFYRLYNLGSFPGLKEDKKNGKAIQGELYLVNDETLKRLDRLEGTPYLYVRKDLQIENVSEQVQGYIFNQEVNDYDECSPKWG